LVNDILNKNCPKRSTPVLSGFVHIKVWWETAASSDEIVEILGC